MRSGNLLKKVHANLDWAHKNLTTAAATAIEIWSKVQSC
jgi:hypothetical protein